MHTCTPRRTPRPIAARRAAWRWPVFARAVVDGLWLGLIALVVGALIAQGFILALSFTAP